MTAVTPAYAHAYQAICLTRHLLANLCRHFRLLKPKARYPYLPNVRSTTRERGSDFRGWAIYTDGGARSVNDETFAGWSVIAMSLQGSVDVMFGPVVTNKTYPAFSGAKASSNNTAEMCAMIEALYFLGPRGSIARNEEPSIFVTPNTPLAYAWALSKPALMCSWHWLVSDPPCAHITDSNSPCNVVFQRVSLQMSGWVCQWKPF